MVNALQRSLQEFFVYAVFLSSLGRVLARERGTVHCAAMAKLFQCLALLYDSELTQKHIDEPHNQTVLPFCFIHSA